MIRVSSCGVLLLIPLPMYLTVIKRPSVAAEGAPRKKAPSKAAGGRRRMQRIRIDFPRVDKCDNHRHHHPPLTNSQEDKSKRTWRGGIKNKTLIRSRGTTTPRGDRRNQASARTDDYQDVVTSKGPTKQCVTPLSSRSVLQQPPMQTPMGASVHPQETTPSERANPRCHCKPQNDKTPKRNNHQNSRVQ